MQSRTVFSAVVGLQHDYYIITSDKQLPQKHL